MNTIQEFRKAGYKIRCCYSRLLINHGRTLYPMHEIREKGLQSKIAAKGGKMILDLTTPDKKDFSATATCSKHDHFNRKIAVAIAIGRLQKSMFQAA